MQTKEEEEEERKKKHVDVSAARCVQTLTPTLCACSHTNLNSLCMSKQ